MIPVFASVVKQKYQIILSDANDKLPGLDYPPANLATMIKTCENAGRSDLANKIKKQWGNVLDKYPVTRLNWGPAVKIGGASIKKNVFEGKEFGIWLKEQGDVAPDVIKEARKVETVGQPPKGTPALAIPKDGETADEWKAEAAKTKEALAAAKKAFSDVKQYISYLEKEASELKKKIVSYGPGGTKSKTKTGESRYAARVPKWEATLKAVLEQLSETKDEIKGAEDKFKTAVDSYNHAPLTTVKYENQVQTNIQNLLEYVLEMKDKDKQRDLLEKLNDAMGATKIGASVEEVTAAGDRVASLFEKLKAGFQAIKNWIKGLNKSVDAFNKLASIRY